MAALARWLTISSLVLLLVFAVFLTNRSDGHVEARARHDSTHSTHSDSSASEHRHLSHSDHQQHHSAIAEHEHKKIDEYSTSHHHPVTHLPGYGKIRGRQYAGYLPIDQHKVHSKLFYWLVYSRNTKRSDADVPLVLWMNGGPGCSSMIGMLVEHGPYKIKHDMYGSSGPSPVLEENPYCWCNSAHMLYLDQPIGVGLSFLDSRDNTSAIPTTQLDVAEHAYHALQHFYEQYPKLMQNPLYLAGESYAGKYIPWMANYILDRNRHSKHQPHIPLAGVMIGNGMVDPLTQRFAYKPVMAANGFFDQYQMEVMTALEQWCKRDLMLANYTAAGMSCSNLQKYMTAISGGLNLFDYRQYFGSYNNTALLEFLNNNDTRLALGVPNHSTQLKAQCDHDVHVALNGEFLKSVKNLLANLLIEVRVLLYNGLFDLKDGPLSTETYVNTINWYGRIGLFNAERYVLKSDATYLNSDTKTVITTDNANGVLGYCKTYANVSMCTVAEAGHLTPLNNPEGMYTIVHKFLTEAPMCTVNNVTNECQSYGDDVCKFLNCRHGTCASTEGGECICHKGYAGVDCGIAVFDLDNVEDLIDETEADENQPWQARPDDEYYQQYQHRRRRHNKHTKTVHKSKEVDHDHHIHHEEIGDTIDGGSDSVTNSHSGIEVRHTVEFVVPPLESAMYYFYHSVSDVDASYFMAATLEEQKTTGELWLELSHANDEDVAKMIVRSGEKAELYQYLAQRAARPEHKTHVSRAFEQQHLITARLRQGYYVLTVSGKNIEDEIPARLSMSITSGSYISVAARPYSSMDMAVQPMTAAEQKDDKADESSNDDQQTLNPITYALPHDDGSAGRSSWIVPIVISGAVLALLFAGYMYYLHRVSRRSDYSLLDNDLTILHGTYTSQ